MKTLKMNGVLNKGKNLENYGFVRVASAIPFGKVAGIDYNKFQIISMIKEAFFNHASLVLFPELSLTSYTCGDLFLSQTLIENTQKALGEIVDATKNLDILSIIGLPLINTNKLFNCAAVINKGKILGIVPKSFVPGYKEFYEPRWFSDTKTDYNKKINLNGNEVDFGTDLLFKDRLNNNFVVGVEICEDLWVPVPPSSYQALSGATVLCNLSASNAVVSKSDYRKDLVVSQSARCISTYIYTSCGMGESTTDIVFDSDSIICENGVVLSNSQRFLRKNQIIYADVDLEKLILERTRLNTFSNDSSIFQIIGFESGKSNFEINRIFDKFPFVPSDKTKLDSRCEEIFNIQCAGLAKRLESLNSPKIVIGISGGLDSTLALLISIKTCKLLNIDFSRITAVTMPGFGTTDKTYDNAVFLCKTLGVTLKIIGIKDLSSLMFEKIEHDPQIYNTTYENVQARSRTFILMSIANQENGIVIGTGDLSESALGWSTYNGDHMSMYNVNSSIPKTLVKFLVNWISENEFEGEAQKVLQEITEQPISPELLPSDGKTVTQKTEDTIGPYELHDFFLYYFVRYGFSPKKILFMTGISFSGKYDSETIKKWLIIFLKRFFSNQWKRDCVPGGIKVGSIDLSPRGSWRMPSEADIDDFIKSL